MAAKPLEGGTGYTRRQLWVMSQKSKWQPFSITVRYLSPQILQRLTNKSLAPQPLSQQKCVCRHAFPQTSSTTHCFLAISDIHVLPISHKMSMSAAALNPEKFSPFHIHSTTYKTVNEHPIGVDVLIPKKLEPGTKKHPLIIRFHGGFLVGNFWSSLFVSSFSIKIQKFWSVH